jgi:hypothetical protein
MFDSRTKRKLTPEQKQECREAYQIFENLLKQETNLPEIEEKARQKLGNGEFPLISKTIAERGLNITYKICRATAKPETISRELRQAYDDIREDQGKLRKYSRGAPQVIFAGNGVRAKAKKRHSWCP